LQRYNEALTKGSVADALKAVVLDPAFKRRYFGEQKP
jgi:hypothetical protein